MYFLKKQKQFLRKIAIHGFFPSFITARTHTSISTDFETEFVLSDLFGDSVYEISVRQRPSVAAGRLPEEEETDDFFWTELVRLTARTETSRECWH